MTEQEYIDLLKGFVATYPEFKSLFFNEDNEITNFDIFVTHVEKIRCEYKEFYDLKKCKNLYPFYMLLAHSISLNTIFSNGRLSWNYGNQGGLVQSASTGNVSISKDNTPYNKNTYDAYLAQTRYGQEFLAWLLRNRGFKYVNNPTT